VDLADTINKVNKVSNNILTGICNCLILWFPYGITQQLSILVFWAKFKQHEMVKSKGLVASFYQPFANIVLLIASINHFTGNFAFYLLIFTTGYMKIALLVPVYAC
jgi:hypothetical protein